MQKPIQKKLANGIRLIMVPLKEAMSVTSAVFVEAGSAYETKGINGISHFLEHMCFKGTEKRPTALQISTELENLGASYNAFTDFDLTGYYATVAAKSFDKAFDVIADMYLHQLLDPKEIEKEKGVIIEEIRMYEDLPRHKVEETLDKLMYGDQPAGWSIAGTEQTVSSFTRDDIAKYLRTHYIAQKTILMIAGNFDPAHAFAKVKEYFSKAPKGKEVGRIPFKKHKAEHISIAEKKLDQSHFMIGFNAVPLSSPERFKISIMSKVLGGGMGSRLFQTIREEMGAAYYIHASTNYNANTGICYVQGGINHGKLKDVFLAVIDELRKMKKSLTDAELIRAKEFTMGNFLLSLEGSGDLAMYYGYQAATTRKIETPAQIVKRLKEVTKDDVLRAAKKYLTKDNFHFALVGPYSADDQKAYEELYSKTDF